MPMGCISESEIGFDPSNRNSACIADFEYSAKRIVNRDHLQLGRVTIDYINENGDFFTSNFLQQPANSFFEILMVEDFEENAAGEPTKKLNMEFLTTLYAPGTDENHAIKGKNNLCGCLSQTVVYRWLQVTLISSQLIYEAASLVLQIC